MRLLLLCALLSASVAASAQTPIQTVPADAALHPLAEWDVAPVAAASGLDIARYVLAGAVCVGAAVWVLADAQSRDEQVDLCTLNLVGYAAVGVAALIVQGEDICGLGLRLGGERPVETAYRESDLAAFATGEFEEAHRERLAAAARARGRKGVVLQRVTQDRGGVGEGAGVLMLEVAVVEAETGRLLRLADDPLAPVTVLSVPVGDDLAAASTEAMHRILG
ncbi:MAG: hypothetical protein AAF791_10190 [Bacteroidota bacterium]